MIATVPTTDIGHMDSKEVESERERCNRAARGYFHRRLNNGNRCLNRNIWYCNGCLVGSGGRTTYVIRISVTALHCIMTPSFFFLDMFDVWLAHNNDECLG